MPRPIAACALAALIAALPLAASAQDADTVVARVGEVEITLGHVVMMRQQLPPQYAQLPDDLLLKGIVDQLVDQQLLGEQVTEAPPSVALKLANERRALLANEAITALMADPVSDADLQAAYDAQFGNVEPEQEYNASHILVESEEDAQAVVAELEGGADFAELAKDRSTGPSGPNGGNLGWFGKGQMVPEFEGAVLALEPETVSAPVQTQFGWHVVRLNEVRDVPPPTLDEARGQLEQELRQQRITDRVASLREAAEVEVLTDGLPADLIRNDDLVSGN